MEEVIIFEEQEKMYGIPLPLGIIASYGRMQVVLPTTARIPVKKEIVLPTTSDNQRMLKIGIYEGNQCMAVDNELLGECVLCGFPSVPAGGIKVQVCFEIEVDGVLTVTAHQVGSNPMRKVTMTLPYGARRDPSEIMRSLLEEEKLRVRLRDAGLQESDDYDLLGDYVLGDHVLYDADADVPEFELC